MNIKNAKSESPSIHSETKEEEGKLEKFSLNKYISYKYFLSDPFPPSKSLQKLHIYIQLNNYRR